MLDDYLARLWPSVIQLDRLSTRRDPCLAEPLIESTNLIAAEMCCGTAAICYWRNGVNWSVVVYQNYVRAVLTIFFIYKSTFNYFKTDLLADALAKRTSNVLWGAKQLAITNSLFEIGY